MANPHLLGLTSQQILVQQCDNCGYLRWPPSKLCPECLAGEQTWAEVEGRGTVWSFTKYHRALNPSFEGQVPYVVGLIDLASGVSIVGRIREGTTSVSIGDTVNASFVDSPDGGPMIEWTME